jgi:hypothetical protein
MSESAGILNAPNPPYWELFEFFDAKMDREKEIGSQ